MSATDRQRYALAHPLAEPRSILNDQGLWATDELADGSRLRTALAVDR
jgi:hypothetical protein